MIPVTPFRQIDDGSEPLLLGDDDDARIRFPALPKVVPQKAGKSEIDGRGQRTDVNLKSDLIKI